MTSRTKVPGSNLSYKGDKTMFEDEFDDLTEETKKGIYDKS